MTLETLAQLHYATRNAGQRLEHFRRIVKREAARLNRAGTTQAAIAQACGVSPARVGQWITESEGHNNVAL